MKHTDLKWWQRAVFYQVYPRSFADGNGDGIGDLYGLIEKLDYLKNLGVEGIWLSPHFPSPQVDCGYDIASYTDVDPQYGTIGTFQTFLDGAHERGMRVVIDLVLNHTSDHHHWFQESKKSATNAFADWYVWRDPNPETGGPPNNWMAPFGGSAWEFVPERGQYYYHYFFKEQPDLNWRNPEVRAAMFQAVRYWLELGVDGFRLDAISTIFEDPDMPNHHSTVSQAELYHRGRDASSIGEMKIRSDEWRLMFAYQSNQPGVHELFQELRLLIDRYDDRVLIGETAETSFYGNGTNELHLAFNFPLMYTTHMTPAWVRDNQKERLAKMPSGAWACNTLGNHDTPRVYSRYGDGQNDTAIARLSLALMLTLKGTPFLYNGEELSMSDHNGLRRDQFKDMLGIWRYNLERELFLSSEEEALRMALILGRDKCRTPMQWVNATNAGFSPTEATPWLPINPNYTQGINVADQEDDPDSMLNYYRRLIQFRQNSPALLAGEYEPIHENAEEYLAFLRYNDEQRCLVFLNYGEQAFTLQVEGFGDDLRSLFSSRRREEIFKADAVTLHPWEVLILEV